MPVALISLSHSPLIDLPGQPPRVAHVKRELDRAMERARALVNRFDPELVVIFAPDHLTSLFMDMMPPFCLGVRAKAIKDFGGTPGTLNVPMAFALELAAAVQADGVDLPLSFDMRVDHGTSQPLWRVLGEIDRYPVIPILLNCHELPLPPIRRVRLLGEAVGRVLAASRRRVLVIGSGGLSHDPRFPQLDAKPRWAGDFVLHGLHRSRIAHWLMLQEVKRRTVAFGKRFPQGLEDARPLNPEWDRQILERLATRPIEQFDHEDPDAITRDAGTGGQEIRALLAAMAAISAAGSYKAVVDFYEPVPEWAIGCGVLHAETTLEAGQI